MHALPGRFVLSALLCGWIGLFANGEQKDADKPAPVDNRPARADLHGDPLPDGARARLGTVRLRNGAGIFTVIFSPDGKRMATAGGSPWAGQGVQSGDNSIRVWEASSGKELRQFKGHPGSVSALAFSPDSRFLAASTPQDNVIRLWDLSANEDPKQIQIIQQNGEPLTTFAFAPDGKSLGIPGGQDQAIQLWDIETGKQARQFGKHSEGVSSIAFSPDGKWGASKTLDSVVLWDANSGEALRKFRPRLYYSKQKQLHLNDGRVQMVVTAGVHFSPDGKLLAYDTADNTLHVCDAATGTEQARLVHGGSVASASFSPDGKSVVTGCQDNTVRVWDTATGKERIHVEGHFGGYSAVAFAPDGKSLASAGGNHTIRLWDAETGKEIVRQEGHQGEVMAGAFSSDGKVLVTTGRDNVFRFWDPATSKQLRRVSDDRDLISKIAVSPDGRTVASWGENDPALRVWNDEGKLLREFPGRFAAATYAPDGKKLVALAMDGKLLRWDLATGKEETLLDGRLLKAGPFALSPDGKHLVLESEDTVVRLWDIVSGKEIRAFEHKGEGEANAHSFVFSPDGRLLAGMYHGNVINVWETESGKHLQHIQHASEASFANMSGSVAFSADGRTIASIASGDRTVRLWETASGEERRRFQGHQGPTSFVAFAPHGRLLASGSWDTTVIIWDALALPGSEPAGGGLDALWIDLSAVDAGRAYLALCKLNVIPKDAVALLEKHLSKEGLPDKARIAKLIADLDNDSYNVRQSAFVELEKLGLLAETQLKETLKGEVSLEVRRRGEQLLEKMREQTTSPDDLRLVRSVELLETLATPEARQLLEKLTTAAPRATLSREAKAAVDRLSKQPIVGP